MTHLKGLQLCALVVTLYYDNHFIPSFLLRVTFFPSFSSRVTFFPPSYIPSFLPSLILRVTFSPSFILRVTFFPPSYLPSFLLSFLQFARHFLPSFLPSFLPPFFPSFKLPSDPEVYLDASLVWPCDLDSHGWGVTSFYFNGRFDDDAYTVIEFTSIP
jgi:hypothetical protein